MYAITLRAATVADAGPISELIRSLSAPFLLTPDGEGAQGFFASISEAALRSYLASDRFCYLLAEAEADGQLAGVVAVRDRRHLYHLFVAPAFQRQGLGRRLWQAARAEAMTEGHDGRFTVNASLGAVAVYERFGFVTDGPRVARDGVAFQPMVLAGPSSSPTGT